MNDHEGKGGFALGRSDLCRGSKVRGEMIPPTAKVFNVVLNVDHGADSVRDIGEDEED